MNKIYKPETQDLLQSHNSECLLLRRIMPHNLKKTSKYKAQFELQNNFKGWVNCQKFFVILRVGLVKSLTTYLYYNVGG